MRPLLDVGALMYAELAKMMFALRLFDLVFQRLNSTEFNYVPIFNRKQLVYPPMRLWMDIGEMLFPFDFLRIFPLKSSGGR